MTFDPYHKWLGIHPSEQPVTYYRLLGVREFESDPDVIEHAADRQMAHLRNFALGRYVRESQQLLNEITQARHVLLTPDRRAAYDASIVSWRSSQTAVATPLAASETVSSEPSPGVASPKIRPGLSRRRPRGGLRATIGIAQILLGGAAGLCVAVIVLWTIWRRDPLGIIGKDIANDISKDATANKSIVPSPSQPRNEKPRVASAASTGSESTSSTSSPPAPSRTLPSTSSPPVTAQPSTLREPPSETKITNAEQAEQKREETKESKTPGTPNAVARQSPNTSKSGVMNPRTGVRSKLASKDAKDSTPTNGAKETTESADPPDSPAVELTREDWIEKRDIALENGDLKSALRAVESLAEMASEPPLVSKLSFLAELTAERFPDQKTALGTFLDLLESAVADGESNAARPYVDQTIARARKLGDRSLERRATLLAVKVN